ncbi:AraC family transcriptional regulator [Devosia sp. Leaf420]|uniref:GlxA family transcriptional regulator n=1 Tax=Devosia sp. Leaf420 TaxID=1736374 RepID=UPI0007155212|nr:helix-turn-helix domain-containing protein [Devosia sp. Leaf420]KQT48163.1 AraC family transcriptional regulator [Devosia sp. Leaf420]
MDDKIEIALVVYPGAQEAALLGLADLFAIANRSDRPQIRATRWQADSNSISPTGETGDPRVLIIPPGLGGPVDYSVARPMMPALRDLHGRGTTLASVCVGAFILGETGLLNGRSATTHWATADAFRSRFPLVNLDVDRLVIDDGDIITAGGMMAWTDLGLKLVDRYLGTTAMQATAATLLIDPPGREQRYYSSFVPRLNHGDAAVLVVQHWLHSQYAESISLSDMTAKSGLEERTFLRRFRRTTSMTATEYLQRFRINKAREKLQFSRDPIDAVAWSVGYRDPSAFRKVFLQIVGLSPSQFRKRFQAHG